MLLALNHASLTILAAEILNRMTRACLFVVIDYLVLVVVIIILFLSKKIDNFGSKLVKAGFSHLVNLTLINQLLISAN